MPRETPPSPPFLKTPAQDTGTLVLPIIKVGSPTPLRLDWVLLLDTLSNGSRGVVALEDTDHFGIAQRILTSSETFVIPRLGATGQPLTYRLEPFIPRGLANNSSWRPPNPPVFLPISLRSLTVTIHHSDGKPETPRDPLPLFITVQEPS